MGVRVKGIKGTPVRLRSTYTGRPTPPSSKGRSHFESIICLGENIKILAMDVEKTEARNDCADEAQKQFNRPTDRETVEN
jgi:hypothetical protein